MTRVEEGWDSVGSLASILVQVLELRPFIMGANRIVIMTRGKLDVHEPPPDLSATSLCLLTELI